MVNAKTWNPAQIDQAIRRLEGIIRSGSYNPAELNQLLNQLGEPGYINTWNPAELDQKLRTFLHDLLSWKTSTGNPIQLRTNNGGLVQSLEVFFSPIQDLHGYDNPWPGGAGKNKWSGGDLSVATTTDIPFVLSAGTYTFSAKTSSSTITGLGFRVYYTDETSEVFNLTKTQFTDGFSKTFSKDITKCNTSISGFSTGDIITEIQVESGETKTSFAPYSNICPISGLDSLHLYIDTEQTETPEKTYTATFSETEYGGSYEFVSGSGHNIYAIKTLTGAEGIDWTLSGTQTLYKDTNLLPDIRVGTSRIYGRCSACPSIRMSTGELSIDNTYLDKPSSLSRGIEFKKVIDFWGLEEATSTALNAKLAELYANGTPVQICYELATPTEITLTPEDIELLAGANVLWTDGDNIEITYKKLLLPSDVESLSISKKIEEKPKTKRSKKKKEE